MGEKKIKPKNEPETPKIEEPKFGVYMKLDDASAYTGIPASTLREKVYHKLLHAYKPARALLFKREDLDHFITKARVK